MSPEEDEEDEEGEGEETPYEGQTATALWEQMHPDQRLEPRADVTVILPSLNESAYVAEKLADYYVVQIRTEPGLARAIKAGIDDADTEFIVVMDADGEHSVRSVPQMLRLLDDPDEPCDMACGVREEWGDGFKAWLSRRGNKWATGRLGLPFADVTSGFWAARRDKILALPERIWHGYGDYYIDLVACAFAADWWIGTVPITYGERLDGKSHTKILDCLSQYHARVMYVQRLMKQGRLLAKPSSAASDEHVGQQRAPASSDADEAMLLPTTPAAIDASFTVLPKDDKAKNDDAGGQPTPTTSPELVALPPAARRSRAKRDGRGKDAGGKNVFGRMRELNVPEEPAG